MMSIPGSNASTRDCSTSKLAPMPQHISSGVPVPFPARTSTRSCWLPTVTCPVVNFEVLGGFEILGRTATGDGRGGRAGASRTMDDGSMVLSTLVVLTDVIVTGASPFLVQNVHPLGHPSGHGSDPVTARAEAVAQARGWGARPDGNALSPAGSRGCAVHCRRSVRRRAQAPRKGVGFMPEISRVNHLGKSGRQKTLTLSRPVGRRQRSQPAVAAALLRQPAHRALVKSSTKPVASSNTRPGWEAVGAPPVIHR